MAWNFGPGGRNAVKGQKHRLGVIVYKAEEMLAVYPYPCRLITKLQNSASTNGTNSNERLYRTVAREDTAAGEFCFSYTGPVTWQNLLVG